jgi:NAD(P)-dependent dehydrogenase (short-subunit alcohol dehydrogenase family)
MIVITGASKGIGKFLFEEFKAHGKEVLGLYNSTQPTSNIENFYQLDLLDEQQVVEFAQSMASKFNRIVLVNSAGLNYNSLAHNFDFDQWKKIFDVNTHGTFLLIKNLLPYMREENFGRIINLSSVVPQIGTQGTAAYAASKAALWGMSKVVANENASKGITVNNLNLGYFDIGMISEVPSYVLDKLIPTIPVKSLGNPMNIFNAVNFLIESDYITGTSININGGLY